MFASPSAARAHGSPRIGLPPMQWNAWGVAEEATTLSPAVLDLVRSALGVSGDPRPVPAIDEVTVAPTRVTDDDRGALADIVGSGCVSVDPQDRLRRAGGKSTPDLLRRTAIKQDAPDAVVAPGTEDEIAAILAWCAKAGVAVVAFGGGTGVVGGLDPDAGRHRAVISLDLHRFDSLIDLDATSGIAVLGAGVSGPRAEELLTEHGFSLGHFPQSFEFATMGGFAATRSSGQDSAGYGRFDDMVVGLTAITPRGTLRLGPVAKSAAGPDLRQMVLGSEGTLGIITAVALRVHPTPPHAVNEAWHFASFAEGAAAVRAVVQRGTGPTVLRLSDEVETGVNLARPGAIGVSDDAVAGGVLAITRFEGDESLCAARRDLTAETLLAAGGTSLGTAPADAWEHGRFRAPYLRDALLAIGVGCETLETATTWAGVPALRDAVVAALTTALSRPADGLPGGSPALVMCHISHTYPTGASLYFTVIYRMGDDPLAQWATAKADACAAIVAADATITHHHAVGADHRPYLSAEIGEVGVEMLRAVKDALDPAGVLNPGTLIP
ncbi:FAD-binding oxidoreductase [Williamsia herbipolensis]|uniref:FAD-binding oxidoreductase n=1 Tax=Williamsia herbipolensis TaxID=1603258 RepID=UPI001EF1337F|nr:FAD-binding oxidoreductase [Williamsia herbipolensis]